MSDGCCPVRFLYVLSCAEGWYRYFPAQEAHAQDDARLAPSLLKDVLVQAALRVRVMRQSKTDAVNRWKSCT